MIIRNRLDSNNPQYARPGRGSLTHAGLASALSIGGSTAFSITGLSASSVTDLSTLTISGAQFGTRTQQTPIKYDACNGTPGQQMDARGHCTYGNGSLQPALSATQIRVAGRTSSAFMSQTNGNVPGFGVVSLDNSYITLTTASLANRIATFPNPWYVDWWMYFVRPSSEGSPPNYKWYRHHSNQSGGQPDRYFGDANGINGNAIFIENGFYSTMGAAAHFENRWVHMQYVAQTSHIQTDVFFRVYKDHVIKFDCDGAGNFVPVDVTSPGPYWTEPNSTTRRASWFLEAQLNLSGVGGLDGQYYVSDFYFDSGWSRVEIGNASTYSACTVREIQPYTAWADGSITITVNKGTLGNGTRWLYVSNTSDQHTAGFPVTVT